MGLNKLSIAAVITLAGAAPALAAEALAQPASPAMATEAPTTDPALAASPIAGAAAPAATAPAQPAAPAAEPALQASPVADTPPTTPVMVAPIPSSAPEQPAAPSAETAPATATEAATPDAAPQQTQGDVLDMPKMAPAAPKKKSASGPISIEVDGMPGRGSSMTQVEKHFGAPRQKLAPVGEPPITRWIYSDYTVYFEHEYVIHSVRNVEEAAPQQTNAPEAATPPAPASGQ